MLLASLDRLPEDVRVLAVIVAELEFRDIERKVFLAHLMKRSDHAALHEGPEALDGLSVNGPHDILALGMVNARMGEFSVEMLIAHPLISAEQANFRRDGLTDEFGKRAGADVLDNACHNLALAAHGTSDDSLACATCTAASVSAFILVPILGFAADKSLVNLDNPHQLAEVLIGEPSSDTMAHIPSRPVRAGADGPMHLKGRNAFLTGQHHMDNAEPHPQGTIGVLEHSPDKEREPIAAARGALIALPMPRPGMLVHVLIATTRAADALRPAVPQEIGAASVLVRESLLPLADSHLVNALFGLGHSRSPELMKGA